MKLVLNNGKFLNVSFWSFVKFHVLTQLTLAGIIYGILFIFWLMMSV